MKAFWKSRPVKTVGILAALLVLGMLIAAATGQLPNFFILISNFMFLYR